MTTYCKLKDGRKMIVFSNNVSEKTMNVYPIEEEPQRQEDYDYLSTIEVSYDDIAVTDTNRYVAFSKAN